MRVNILTASSLLAFVLTGCGASPLSDDWIERRPLARALPTHQPPRLDLDADDAPAPTRVPVVEPAGELTLRRALELALLNSPQLKPIAWERRASEARTIQAGLPPNPTIGFMVEDAGGTGANRSFEGAESTLRLSQLIETADKRLKRIALADADRQRVLWDYEAMRVQVAADTAQRFYEVLAGQERVRLARETLKLAGQTLKLVEERVKAGTAAPVERDKALVRLTTENIALDRAQRQLDTARFKLAALWDSQRPQFTAVSGALGDAQPIPSQENLAAKLAQNPQVARWSAEIAQRRAAVDLARAKAAPDVTGSVGVRRMNDSDDTVYLFEVMVPLPIFDRNQGGILEARYGVAKATSEQRSAEVTVRTMLAQAYNEFAAAHHEATTLREQALPAAQSAFEAVRKSFEAGKSAYLDVLDAQRTLVDTQRDLINALAAYHGAVAAVEGLIGESIQGAAESRP